MPTAAFLFSFYTASHYLLKLIHCAKSSRLSRLPSRRGCYSVCRSATCRRTAPSWGSASAG